MRPPLCDYGEVGEWLYSKCACRQQGVSAVWVALGGRCLAWTGALLSDARLEALGGGVVGGSPAPLRLLAQHSAHQRELRLAAAAPLHQVFYQAKGTDVLTVHQLFVLSETIKMDLVKVFGHKSNVPNPIFCLQNRKIII